MPAHHDTAFARAQGAPDMFMNILTTNGYVSRFVTDWAGPEAMLKSIKIRLGAPAVPGKPLRFTGQVTQARDEGDERMIEVAMRAANELGDHCTGTVVVTLPCAKPRSA
jgi:acyl dehydratase